MAIVVPANEEGRKFYEKAEVKPAKWLLPDGSITDKFPMSGGGGSDVKLQNNKEVSITENGEIEITPDEGYDGVKKVTATVNVPSSVETTKQATIDVLTYDPSNKPVIVPTSGKQSMAEVEVTLSNIPSGDDLQLYYWADSVEPDSGVLTTFATAPVVEVGGTLSPQQDMSFSAPDNVVAMSLTRNFNYARVSDTSFSLTDRGGTTTYVRDSEYDITLSALVASTI